MKPDEKVVKISQDNTVDIRDSRLASTPLGLTESNSNSNDIKPSEIRPSEQFETPISPISDKNHDVLDHTMLNRFLTFRNPDLEREFFHYFTNLNLARWRRTLSALFITMSTIYIYLITRNSMEWVEWKAKYAPSLKTGPLICQTGYFWY